MATQTDASTSINPLAPAGSSNRNVPVNSAMFNQGGPGEAGGQGDGQSNLTRTWVVFFEYLSQAGAGGGGGGSSPAGPFHRTLLLKDLTIGSDIADHVTVYGAPAGHTSTCFLVTGVLRKSITMDLTVKIQIWISGTKSLVGTFTIPAATATNAPISWTTGFTTPILPDKSVFSWDITASDGQQDAKGIAAFCVEWTPN
jgi:hypothetical protein